VGPAWGTYAACHTRRHGRDDARDGLCEGHVRDAGGAAAKAGAASDMVRVRRRYDDPNCNETATHVSKRRFVRGVGANRLIRAKRKNVGANNREWQPRSSFTHDAPPRRAR
jgi:hypothetical protein